MENFQKWDPKKDSTGNGAITGNGNAISSTGRHWIGGGEGGQY